MNTSVEKPQYQRSLPHIASVTTLKFNQGLPGAMEGSEKYPQSDHLNPGTLLHEAGLAEE